MESGWGRKGQIDKNGDNGSMSPLSPEKCKWCIKKKTDKSYSLSVEYIEECTHNNWYIWDVLCQNCEFENTMSTSNRNGNVYF